jgi:hypothetical protein
MTDIRPPNYIPTLDEAVLYIRSNPAVAWEILREQIGLATEAEAVSDGRLRELWKLNGGAVGKGNRAWIEVDLLPRLLREVVSAVVRAARHEI